MYDWGGRRVSPEDYADLLAEEAAIEADRQARIDALISHDGERGGCCCSFRRPRRAVG